MAAKTKKKTASPKKAVPAKKKSGAGAKLKVKAVAKLKTFAKLKALAKKKGASAKAAVKRVVRKAVAKLPRRTEAVSPSAGLTIEQWVAKKIAAEQVPVASAIMMLVAEAAPDAKGVIKWGQPVFELNGPMAYFRGSKEHVTFGFWRGTQLTDPNGLLEGEGDRMKHIKLRDTESMPREALKQFVKQAAQLNREQGSPAMRGSK